MSKYPEINLAKVKLTSIAQRQSKVQLDALARPVEVGAAFAQWWDALPNFLAAEDLKAVAEAIASAHKAGKPVIVMMGAHVIKVGLSPVLIDLMKQGVITALALNGSGIIHDVELALFGATSEDVAANLADGSFGMVKETGDFINQTVKTGAKAGLGLGEASFPLGRAALQQFVVEHELGVFELGEGDPRRLGRALLDDQHVLAADAGQPAAKASAAVHQAGELDLGLQAPIGVEVLQPRQGPVDAGG